MIRKLIDALEAVDKRLDKEYRELQPKLRDEEIKTFFRLRHYETKKFVPLQRYVIQQWEPRVSRLAKRLDMTEYSKIRDILGLGKLEGVSYFPETKKNDYPDYIFQAREVYDLRDEVKESASSITRTKQ